MMLEMLVNTNVCFVSWNHNSFHFGFQRSHLSFDGMKLRKEDMSPNSSVSPLSPFPNPYCLDPVFFFLTFLTHLLPLIHSQHILYSLISAPYQIPDPVPWWPRLCRPCVERISGESILFAITPIASGLRTPSEAPVPVFTCGHRLTVLLSLSTTLFCPHLSAPSGALCV